MVDGFEWDPVKAATNAGRPHRVRFEDAATVFGDPMVVVDPDRTDRDVFVAIGFAVSGRLLTVVHQARGEKIRIISAWRATAEETRRYTEGG